MLKSDEDDSEREDADETRSVASKTSRASKRSRKASQGKKVKLIEDEKTALGRVCVDIQHSRYVSVQVKFSVYMTYFHSMGIIRYFVPFAIALSLNSTLIVARSFWLTDWSNDNTPGADASLAKPLGVRLGVYAVLGFSEVVFLYLALTTLILGGVAASLKLHKPLFHNVLRSPLSYFDVTPLGRFLNRLGKVYLLFPFDFDIDAGFMYSRIQDMETVDLRLSSNFRFLAMAFMNVLQKNIQRGNAFLQTCIIISISVPLFIIVIIPIFIIYIFILVR
ncbi:unnamed protein product [Cylicostephanus goldi]|uniref:ABC transmembrane type-1 domain-containing protein n=1 Tax=Cylicostephanus goldi TaxID=71465 RepID=A0A3P6TBC6_CYLGO|nr:unnamed protein product [Cylicostephanus goldi]